MNNSIFWILFIAALLGAELFYFRVARVYKILDHPNHRSLHEKLTIRGGGVIFFISSLLYYIIFQQPPHLMMAGLALVSIVGFIDDVKSLSSALRFVVQSVAFVLVFSMPELYTDSWVVVVLFIGCVGALNAFNFMDGINGLTGGYALVALGTLAYVNRYIIAFFNEGFIFATIAGVLVFCFFNFRRKAICFAGDVGSLSIGFIVISLIVTLVVTSGNWAYIFFLSVYGVDSVLTIIHRIMMKENIFKPHRHHLFQVIVYITKISHVQMSVIYLVIQLVCNVIVILALSLPAGMQVVIILGMILTLSTGYILVKRNLLQRVSS